MESDSFLYEIKGGEIRGNTDIVLRLIQFVIVPGIIVGFLFSVIRGDYSIGLWGLCVLFIAGATKLLGRTIQINKYFPYPDRNYVMDDSGIVISKGKKTKKYLWGEFSGFLFIVIRLPLVSQLIILKQ